MANFFMLVDISGSMNGKPIQTVKDVGLVDGPVKWAVFAFNDNLSQVVPLTASKTVAIGGLMGLSTGGGTRIHKCVVELFGLIESLRVENVRVQICTDACDSIDEASMKTRYELFKSRIGGEIPASCRVLLIGDPTQGCGPVLKRVFETDDVPSGDAKALKEALQKAAEINQQIAQATQSFQTISSDLKTIESDKLSKHVENAKEVLKNIEESKKALLEVEKKAQELKVKVSRTETAVTAIQGQVSSATTIAVSEFEKLTTQIDQVKESINKSIEQYDQLIDAYDQELDKRIADQKKASEGAQKDLKDKKAALKRAHKVFISMCESYEKNPTPVLAGSLEKYKGEFAKAVNNLNDAWEGVTAAKSEVLQWLNKVALDKANLEGSRNQLQSSYDNLDSTLSEAAGKITV